jgi:succinoglycan biosynthesis protein ExoM
MSPVSPQALASSQNHLPLECRPETAIRVSICVCTFRRAALLRRLLDATVKLDPGDGLITWKIVVVDNDADGSARSVVQKFSADTGTPVTYAIEPQRNFALVRNRALQLADGDFIAFVDDDEVPVAKWLLNLVGLQRTTQADGVLGPVRPYFDSPPPGWLVRSRICERPAHPTGMQLDWSQCRTGNVLLKREVLQEKGIVFDSAFALGGEDVDFFKRASRAGCRFVWCEEAPAYELVPPERCRRSYYIRRALLQGAISSRYSSAGNRIRDRFVMGAHAVLGVAAYTLGLPFLFLCGEHVGMKYLIKCCHHVGRVCALCGFNIVNQRP